MTLEATRRTVAVARPITMPIIAPSGMPRRALLENQEQSPIPAAAPRKYGAVAVVRRDEKWLMIRRSANVRAPRKLCFPGGAIEPGESELAAVARELQEELGAASTPIACVWRSLTSWNVALAWWSVDLPAHLELAANPQEVEAIHWFSTEEALAHPDLLESAREFFEAYARGEIASFGP